MQVAPDPFPAESSEPPVAHPPLHTQDSTDSWTSTASDAALIDREADRLDADGRRSVIRFAQELLRDTDLSTPPSSPEAMIDRFLVAGDPSVLPDALPADLRAEVDLALRATPDPDRPSARLRALIDALGRRAASAQRWLDLRPAGRAGLNLAHAGTRNLIAVSLPTVARQAIGRALDLALRQGPGEVARTVLSCACLMLPVVGQGALLARDERRGRATSASRIARGTVIAQQVGVTALGLASGTVLGLGHCLASGLLYPLMRDTVQARVPLRTDPRTGPTRVTLVSSVLAYALGQLMLSRIYLAFPDAQEEGAHAGDPLMSGCAMRGLANGAFELMDLLLLVGAQHLARHGWGSQPRVRMGLGDVRQALRSQQYWDTMSARGAHVLTIGQIYHSLSADHMLPAALTSRLGEGRGAVAADWITELIAFGASALSYAVWTDPLHARGAVLQTIEEAHRGEPTPRQFAGNREEPAVAGDAAGAGELTGFADAGLRLRAGSLQTRAPQ